VAGNGVVAKPKARVEGTTVDMCIKLKKGGSVQGAIVYTFQVKGAINRVNGGRLRVKYSISGPPLMLDRMSD